MANKTLIFIEDGSFTYDNRVIREGQALIKNGWQVVVISPRSRGDSFIKRLDKNLIAYYYYKPQFNSYLGHFVELLFTLVLGSILTLFVKIKHGFDIFHACNPMDILWIIYLPYKFLGTRFIFDQHDLVPELIYARTPNQRGRIISAVMKIFEKISYKIANVVITPNESYKEIAISRGGKKPDNVFVVRNGPELRYLDMYRNINHLADEAEIIIGYEGNMNPQDGLYYLLEAIKILKDKYLKNIKCILIGGGSLLGELKKYVNRVGLDNHVTFTGHLKYDEVLKNLSKCTICVQPDPYNLYNDLSTMNKVLDYMLLGKPIVAFNLKETKFSCGDSALYADANDVNNFAEKIFMLITNYNLRAKMGDNGRKRIESKLAWEYSIPNLLNAYSFAIGKLLPTRNL